ncbi:MAG: PRC-barrel domain-containing protein [Nocardioides sp.]
MLTQDQLREVIGSTAYGSDGEKLGKVGQVYLDDHTGEPEFASVNTGLFGTDETFVPLGQARFEGDRLSVPYAKEQVKDAPKVSPDAGHIDETEEQRLYRHYGMEAGAASTG